MVLSKLQLFFDKRDLLGQLLVIHPTEPNWNVKITMLWSNYSDLTRPGPPNGGLVRGIPLFQGNLGWWNIIICPECFLGKKNIKLNWCQLEFWSFSRHQGRWLYMGGNVGWWNMGFLCITKTLVVSLCLVVLDWRIQFGCNKTSGIIVVLWYQLQHYYCGKTTGMIWENQGWHHFRKLGVLPHRSTVATRIVTFFWIRGCTPWLHPRWRNCTSISW